MEDFNSKYTGQQVEDLLDQVASGNGGGGIAVETDPIFSASPAATITEEKIAEWDSKSAQGDKGDTGVGIQSVVQTTTSNADGGSNIVTVTLTDGTTSTFTVKNGSKGSQGIQGEQGPKGDKGDKGDTGANGTNGANGKDGADGATFTPSVDSAGNLSWANNKGLTNPPTVNIKGPKGDKGDAGEGGGGSGEDIRYFTEFTVEDFIEACITNSTITYDTEELFNAMRSNKVICVPYRDYDKGFVVASYKSEEDVEYPYIFLQKGDVEYVAWTGDDHELVGEIPIYNSVQVVEMEGGEVFLDTYDNHIYKITERVDYLFCILNYLHKGSTILFKSGADGTTIEIGDLVDWANGVIPQIEPNTFYELSLMSKRDSTNAVLTPFKPVE